MFEPLGRTIPGDNNFSLLFLNIIFSTSLRLEWICAQCECHSLPLTSVGAGAELVLEPVEILAGTLEFVHSFESYRQIIACSRNIY